MKSNYSAKKAVVFAFMISVTLAVAVYLWSYQSDTYVKQIDQYNKQLISLIKISTLNNEINQNVKNWPHGYNKDDAMLFDVKLTALTELINSDKTQYVQLQNALKNNEVYWLSLSDHSLKISIFSNDATSSFYSVLNSISKSSTEVLTLITRLPEQHNTFINEYSKTSYAAIKRDIEQLKKLFPKLNGEMDRYMESIEGILSQVTLVEPILSQQQATRFERENDLSYHIKSFVDQRKAMIGQLQVKEETHYYYLFAFLFIFVLLFLTKLYLLVKNIEIYRTKAHNVERYAKRKVTQYKIAEKAKSNFLMVISYEARTALDVIMGLTTFVAEQNNNKVQKSKLDQVNSTSKKLNELLNDVLELLDLDMKNIELESEIFSPSNVLKLLGEKYKGEAKNAGILFEELIDQNFNGNYIGDQRKFYQLIDYLLSNSFSSTEKGHVSFTATLDAGRGLSDQYQRINFQIEDTGLKPSSNEIESLFESFSMTKFQASRKAGSEGIRLSIVKSLASLMKGDIEASHTGSDGMKYNLHIYLELSDEGHEPISLSNITDEPSPDHVVEIPSLNLLIVEDNSVNAFLLKWILEGFKHTVTIAKNGIECLNLVETADFDLIFMDQHMPEMDGVEATEGIRALNNHKAITPIIGCTADAFQETRVSLLNAGQNDIIIKPITNTVVADVIQKYLQGDYKIEPVSDEVTDDTTNTNEESSDNEENTDIDKNE